MGAALRAETQVAPLLGAPPFLTAAGTPPPPLLLDAVASRNGSRGCHRELTLMRRRLLDACVIGSVYRVQDDHPVDVESKARHEMLEPAVDTNFV